MEYRVTRVVFGVTSSPFLLNATLLKHITSHERRDPELVNQMLRSLYVDDLSLRLKHVDKAYQLYLNSRDRMAHGGFTLRKWLTNSRPLMEKIKEMESPREFSIQTEKGNQLDEDDETYHRIMVGDLEARDVNTE